MTQKKRQLSHFLNFYVFLTVELPDSARFDVVVMPNLYERTKDLLKKGAIILVEGNIDRPQSCLARTIQAVEVPQQ